MSDMMRVFDRRAVRRHRDRAAAGLEGHDFLLRAAAERLADRLLDIRRRFTRVLDLGCHHGVMAPLLRARGDLDLLVQADLSPAMVARATGLRVAADEEFLPFAPASFDLVVSVLSLHWVNDLPGALLQIRRCLRPDGLFLGCMLGGGTLGQLRQALLRAEAEVEGGASPRVSPFAEVRDGGQLLQRAGFMLPVADGETLTVTYPDALALMRDIRGMGESNAGLDRRRGLTRAATLGRAAALYAEAHAGTDGRIPATFEFVTLTGWHPHESQPKPLPPGSATRRLADALGGTEQPAGDPARPQRPGSG